MSKATMNNGIVNVEKVTFNKDGNIKLGNMWSWNTLKGNNLIHINYNGIEFDCVGSCGKMCETCGCTEKCYVNKSYNRYPSVKYGHAVNTLAMRTSMRKVFTDLYNQLANAKKKPEFVRIHSSGEFESIDEIRLFNFLAYHFPEVRFYTYSKNFDLWDKFLSENAIQSNFILNVSIWHESGIDFFRKWRFMDNIKAFVYDDGFDYASAGLIINSHCKAYDKKGKMNHAITCDKCKKCMRYNNNYKVVACYDHS